MDGLFAALDRDWYQLLHHRGTPRRYLTWQTDHPRFASYDSLDDLMAAARRQDRPANADRILAALAGRAAADDLAARALLQAILPGLRRLATVHHWIAPVDELEATLVAIAWQHIRCYPVTARPRRIAANLLLDTGHHLRRDCQGHSMQVPVEAAAPDSAPLPPSEELTELVVRAVTQGTLQPEPAALILRTRVLDQTVTDIADALGYPADTIRHRRRRAELVLKATA